MKKRSIHWIFWVIFVAVAIIAIILISPKYSDGSECKIDADCVPSTCCHPTSCVLLKNAPDCSDTFCSQECVPGTLDCGQGHCECQDGNCISNLK